MSASALLLHRMLIKSAGRGWKAPATSHGDVAAELTQTAQPGNVCWALNSLPSQSVNADSDANPSGAESPHRLPTEDRNPAHA